MGEPIRKTLFIDQDPQGRELMLVAFRDGRWGILVDGKPEPTSWAAEQLAMAARAYRERVLASQSSSTPT